MDMERGISLSLSVQTKMGLYSLFQRHTKSNNYFYYDRRYVKTENKVEETKEEKVEAH